MAIFDKSLHFGLQNFICCAIDETDLIHNYYGYVNKKGAVLVMRTDKTPTELLYFCSSDPFAAIWAGKAGLPYVLPNALVDPIVEP